MQTQYILFANSQTSKKWMGWKNISQLNMSWQFEYFFGILVVFLPDFAWFFPDFAWVLSSFWAWFFFQNVQKSPASVIIISLVGKYTKPLTFKLKKQQLVILLILLTQGFPSDIRTLTDTHPTEDFSLTEAKFWPHLSETDQNFQITFYKTVF